MASRAEELRHKAEAALKGSSACLQQVFMRSACKAFFKEKKKLGRFYDVNIFFSLRKAFFPNPVILVFICAGCVHYVEIMPPCGHSPHSWHVRS